MFDFEKWKDQNVCMHCKNEEEAQAFCEEMHIAGLKWKDGDDYIRFTEYSAYKENTVYIFNEGNAAGIDYAVKNGIQILEYSDWN